MGEREGGRGRRVWSQDAYNGHLFFPLSVASGLAVRCLVEPAASTTCSTFAETKCRKDMKLISLVNNALDK